jgi:hypothetical protein
VERARLGGKREDRIGGFCSLCILSGEGGKGSSGVTRSRCYAPSYRQDLIPKMYDYKSVH